jgi:DNA-binding HxlR family transcriptional regulator
MTRGYGQFCPIAKASEIFATRWTPLLLRELMSGGSSFNDLHRGVPLMSRALLAERLRQLEHEGIIEKRTTRRGAHMEYWLTPAGDAFRDVIDGLARWGTFYARDRLETSDLDPVVFMWTLAPASFSGAASGSARPSRLPTSRAWHGRSVPAGPN